VAIRCYRRSISELLEPVDSVPSRPDKITHSFTCVIRDVGLGWKGLSCLSQRVMRNVIARGEGHWVVRGRRVVWGDNGKEAIDSG
jgi:hypothetical protein